MWVFGDLACPNDKMARDLNEEIKRLGLFGENDFVVGNLEGVLVEDGFSDHRKKLYNSKGVIDLFKNTDKTALSIANNHTYDYPDKIIETKDFLEANDIECMGLVEHSNCDPSIFHVRGKKYIIFAQCWNLMTKLAPNKVNKVRINDCIYEDLINNVKKARKENEDAYIMAFLHWSFDMEELPFPSHRMLSKNLIDVGANAVVGNHTHCVNGGEIYKNGIIIYGLGNFFIADGEYHGKEKYFPDFTHLTMVVDIKENVEDTVCYWLKIESQPKVSIELVAKENFIDGELIKKASPFRGMSHDEYINYYKKNRSKGFLVPVYKNYYDSFYNRLKDAILYRRISLIRKIRGYS